MYSLNIVKKGDMDENKIANLLQLNIDITNCLTNCSNRGTCDINLNNSRYYICKCDQNYGGNRCEKDLRLCSNFQCFNDGICINKINATKYDFECNCSYPYSGKRCEIKQNLCLNKQCSKQGICKMNKTAANCICFKGYSGLDCEIVSKEMKEHKRNINIIVYVVIIVFVVFVVFIVGLDILGCHIKRQQANKQNKQNK
jgi:hypothetical protein